MANNTSLSDYTSLLKRKMWITKGSRLEAYRDFLGGHGLSNFAISFFSAYVIIINFLSLYKVIGAEYDPIVQFTTMGLSVLILAFSQIEASNDYKLKAENFHNCAREISKLLNDLDYLEIKYRENQYFLAQEVKSISDQYDILIQKYSESHSAFHYKTFRAKNPFEFPEEFCKKLTNGKLYKEVYRSELEIDNKLKIFLIKLWSYLSPRFLYWLLIIVPLILLLSIVSFKLPTKI